MQMSPEEQSPNDGAGSGPPGIVRPAAKSGPFTRLRNYFLTGIVVTAPIAITIYIAWLFIGWVDGTVTPLIPHRYNPESYLPFGLPGLGLVVAAVFLTFVGFITANIVGRTVIASGERLLHRMPIVRTVYGSLKQIFETVLQHSSTSFRQVVLVEYPRRGLWSLAFVSGSTKGEVQRRTGEEDMVNIFLASTPNPTTGFLMFVPAKDLIYLDMTVEEAAKMIISAGVITPPDRYVELADEEAPGLPEQPAKAAGT